MKCLIRTLVGVFLSTTMVTSQTSYLDRPDLLEKVERCLEYTYGYSFTDARRIQAELAQLTPGHPAPVFLEALLVYWENFPLLPSKEASKDFIRLMELTTKLAKDYSANEETYLEGVFFDLYGRAFKTMFWADNGKSGKVLGDLRIMYRHTKEGFKLQEQYVEFYFSTGLYNYYIEAYPEAHPVYKPLVSFMHEGDRELGLKQLNHAIRNAVFLKVESQLFMSLIQLNFEKDLNTAAIYAETLVREYPANIYYQGHLITILLHQHRYEKVRVLLAASEKQQDRYSRMIRSLASAYMSEKESGSWNKAEKEYVRNIELAEAFGPFSSSFQAMGYMGLSRIYEQKGRHKEAKKYARFASKLTSFSFILEDQPSGSR